MAQGRFEIAAFDIAAVVAALIGAISGSLGGNIISDCLRRKNEKDLLRKTITDRHLLQLQESIESLWFRFGTIKDYTGWNLRLELVEKISILEKRLSKFRVRRIPAY